MSDHEDDPPQQSGEGEPTSAGGSNRPTSKFTLSSFAGEQQSRKAMSQETKRRLLDLQQEYQRIKLETGYDSDDSDFENVDAVYALGRLPTSSVPRGRLQPLGIVGETFSGNGRSERLVGQNGD